MWCFGEAQSAATDAKRRRRHRESQQQSEKVTGLQTSCLTGHTVSRMMARVGSARKGTRDRKRTEEGEEEERRSEEQSTATESDRKRCDGRNGQVER